MQRGFTLLELVIVMALLSVATAMVAPALGRSLAVQELDGAARRLAADIRLVQTLSVNGGGLVYRLQFITTSPYGYIITHPGNAGPVVDKKVLFPAHIRLGATSDIWYNMNGFVGSGQSIDLRSNAAPGAWRRVLIEGAVGRVRIDGGN